MSTGYDEDGSISRLICASPPDGGGDGSSVAGILEPDEFIPNCFLNSTAGQLLATVAFGTTWLIGLDDFALEAWVMPFGIGEDLPGTFDADNPRIGNVFESGGLFEFDNNIAGVGPNVRTVTNGGNAPNPFLAPIPGATIVCPAGWTHYAANFDRDALCTFYMNGAVVDTVDISAFVADTMSQSGVQPNQWIYMSGSTRCSFAIGPVALHSGRLLTAAEIRNSMVRRGVQQIPGVTRATWDWRDVRGHTGWETRTGIIPANRYSHGMAASRPITMPWAVPMGPWPSTYVMDLSGNGNNGLVITLPSYVGVVAGDEDGPAFGSDLFFR